MRAKYNRALRVVSDPSDRRLEPCNMIRKVNRSVPRNLPAQDNMLASSPPRPKFNTKFFPTIRFASVVAKPRPAVKPSNSRRVIVVLTGAALEVAGFENDCRLARRLLLIEDPPPMLREWNRFLPDTEYYGNVGRLVILHAQYISLVRFRATLVECPDYPVVLLIARQVEINYRHRSKTSHAC